MLCEVTSSARCCASRPRSVVWIPRKVETGIALGLQVEDAVRALSRGGAGGLVASLRLLAHEAHQVVEERELLPHERAVDAVLTGDLVEQAAELRAAVAGRIG